MTDEKRKIEELLSRGVAEVIDYNHLKERLEKGEKLRVKLGIDPTSPNIHLGRAVSLLKLRDFQELGHQVVFIVGDFTGVIGDTSDKESERPMLTPETVKENMQSYVEQAGKLLDLSTVEVRYNAEWLSELSFQEVCEMADVFSLAEFNARENIRKRLDGGKRVSLREMLYPLMQGYDSVAVSVDVELGGMDQRFNLLAGRELQRSFGKPAQDILMTNLILGTDGRKMSSSWGNTINLLDVPNEMFGKVMSVPDELIVSYFTHCTRLPMEEVSELEKGIANGANPRDAKLRLAKEIVSMYHGADEAEKAEQYFIEIFSKKQIPDTLADVTVVEGEKLIDVIVKAGFAESKGEARRKIEQGGVEIDGVRITDTMQAVTANYSGKVLKVGKKDFVRVRC